MKSGIKVIFGIMSDMVAFRDASTGGHLDRTRKYLELLIGRMAERGLYGHLTSRWDMDLLLSSAPLHDVGKIAISEELLNKPGKLTVGEFEIMKTHATLGVKILDCIDLNFLERLQIRYARIIAGSHHERWDGSGYPHGLYGVHIPLEGRLMAIADVYDALISDRPYKQAVPPTHAASIIEQGSGTHFDPLIVDIFRDVSHKFEQVAIEYAGHDIPVRMPECACLAS
jgi:putative two-component system response regulator